MLIIGPSGSGKSTLALQLAQAGWSYLSDDELLLSLVDGVVEARGFRSFFAMSEAGARFKHCFEPEAVLGSKRTSTLCPVVCFLLDLNGESRSEIERIDASRNHDAFDHARARGPLTTSRSPALTWRCFQHSPARPTASISLPVAIS